MKNTTGRFVAFPAAAAVGLTAFVAGPASAGTDLAKDLDPSAAAEATRTRSLSGASKAAESIADGLRESGVGAKDLTDNPDYYVFDVYYDGIDSAAWPEYTGSALGVSKSRPASATVVGLATPYTSGYTTEEGGVAGLLLETNGDSTADYRTLTPAYTYMYLDTAYTTRIEARQGSTWVDTGVRATWLRGDDFYGVSFDWKQAGLKNVRWTMGLIDQYDDADFSPNDFGQTIDLEAGQTPPPPPAAPAPAPSTPPPTTPAPTTPPATAPKPGRVKRVSKRVRKGVTVVKWRKAKSATSYRIKVSRNGKRMKNFGTVTTRRVSIATKKRVKYRVSITPLNSNGRGPSAKVSFRGK